MSEFAVKMRLEAQDAGATAAINRLRDSVNGLNDTLNRGKATANQTASGLGNVGKGGREAAAGADAATNSMQSLQRAAQAVIGLGVAKAIITMADSYANMAAKTALAAGSQQQFAVVQRELFAIAQRTSQTLDTTVTLYTRLANSMRDAGVGNRQLLQLTERINQALVVSGATAGEASGAITQLSQALASGALRGEEFNSVNEAAPRIMEALAKSLGVTRGALKEMAAQGELTAEKIMAALNGIEGDRIAAEFAALPLTVGRAWVQLQNAVTQAIGQVDSATGGTTKLANAIKFVADNLSTMVPLLVTLGEVALVALATKAAVSAIRFAFGLGEAYKAATLASTGMKTLAGQAQLLVAAFAGWQLGTYLRENFLTAELAGIAFVEGTLVGWERVKQGAQVAFEGVQFVWNAVIGAMSRAFAGFLDGVASGVALLPDFLGGDTADSIYAYAESLRPAKSATDEFRASVDAINASADAAVATIRETTGAMADDAIAASAARAANGALNEALSDSPGVFKAAGDAADDASKKTAKWRDEMEKLASAVLVDGPAEQLMKLAMAIEEAQRRGNPGLVNQLTRAYNMLATQVEKTALEAAAAKNSMAALLDPVAELLDSYNQEARLLGMSADARARYSAVLKAEADARKAIEEAANRGIVYSQREREEIIATARARADGLEVMKEAAAQTEAYQQIVTSGFNSVADAIGEAFTGGIKSASEFWGRMKDIARRMVSDMIAEFFRLKVIKPILDGLFNGTGGGGGFWGAAASMALSAFTGGGSGGGGTAGATGSLVNAGVAAIAGPSAASGGGGGGGFGGGSIYTTALNYAGGTAFGQAAGQAILGTANYLGPAMAYGGAIAGGAYGFTQRGSSNGSAGSLGATAAYAGLGYVGGTIAAGAVLGGAGAAAAGAGVAGGAALGASGAAMAIPIVGWILAIIALIDLVAGGKLFGTRYKPDEFQTTMGIAEDGGTARFQVREERQRALFGGRQARYRDLEVPDDLQRAADAFYKGIIKLHRSAAQALDLDELAPIIEGAFTQVFDAYDDNPLKKEFGEMLGRTFEEPLEQFKQRLAGANILSAIAAALDASQIGTARFAGYDDGEGGGGGGGGRGGDDIPTTIKAIAEEIDRGSDGIRSAAHNWSESFSAIMAIAVRWDQTGEEFLAGAQFLLAAAADMVHGIGLLGTEGTLTDIADLIEDMAADGETLVQTYARVQTSVMLMEQALDLTGTVIEGTRLAFVQLSVAVTDALGGIDNATTLWNRFFSGFYDSGELLAMQIESMRTTVGESMAGLGFDTIPSLEAFKEAFTAALPTLSAEEIAEWLRGADALLTLSESVGRLDEETRRANEAADRAATAGQSDFFTALYTVTTAANRAADAARAQGASETALALIHMNAARTIGQAIGMLRARTQDLISQLYGGLPGTLEEVNRRIQELEGTVGDGGPIDTGIGGVSDALSDLFARWESGLQAIAGWLDDILLNDQLTTLNPQQQLEEAGSQFYAALAQANAGDADALAALPQLANQFLGLARGFYSSGDDYTAIFQGVMAAMQQAGQLPNPGNQGGGDTGGGGTYTVLPSPEMAALLEQRDILLGAQGEAYRAQLALDLAAHLNQLAQAINTPVLELAGLMGVSLEALATDLGINLEEITSESVQGLATMASVLGVSLTELTGALGIEMTALAGGLTELTDTLGIDLSNLTAESTRSLGALAASLGIDLSEMALGLGLDLGELADSQSLLNNALEAEINALPASQREQLRGLFEAIETATTEADANAAIAALEEAVGEMSPDLQDRLAPFLRGIIPTSQSADVRELITANSWLASMDELLFAAVGELQRLNGDTPNAAAAMGPPMAEAMAMAAMPLVGALGDVVNSEAFNYLGTQGGDVYGGGAGPYDAAIAQQVAGLREDTRTGSMAMLSELRAIVARVEDLETVERQRRDIEQRQADRG